MDDLLKRTVLCNLLAQLYRRELSADTVDALERHGLWKDMEANGYRLSRSRLQDPDFLRELSHEYTRIFIGPHPKVSPYGSVHHPDDAKKGQLWGDTTTWVRRFILDHGLKFDGSAFDGIPDHVGHELEFYAHLLDAESRAQSQGANETVERLRNSQVMFFRKQLDRWLPEFCEQVRKATDVEFFREIARLTADLLSLERDRLAIGTANSQE